MRPSKTHSENVRGVDQILSDSIRRRIVVALDLDYFFAQCEEVRHPELKKCPVVVCVYSGRTEDSGAVSTANYIARSFGVRSGIPIIRAKRLLANEPNSVFLPMDSDYYEAISDRIMHLIRSHSKLFERVSIDEAFIDISSESNTNYDVATSIGEKIRAEIKKEEALTCSIGIAANKLLAKMAADSKKPGGLVTLIPDQVNSFLNELPVRKLMGVGPKIEATMRALNITTIQDLSNFEEEVLAERFGRNMARGFKLLARGLDEDPVRERTAEQYSRIITLKSDADSFSFAEQIRALSLDISNWLKTSQRRCRIVGVIYVTSSIKMKNRSMTLSHDTDSAEEIFQEASALYDRIFASEDGPDLKVRRVGVRVSRLSADTTQPETGSSLSDYFETV